MEKIGATRTYDHLLVSEDRFPQVIALVDVFHSDRINLHGKYDHPKYGSYLSALVIFGKLTGINPASSGANEKAAADLGISPGDAVKLQRVAWDQLADEMPLTTIPCLHANPNAKGAGAGSQSALVCGRGRGK